MFDLQGRSLTIRAEPHTKLAPSFLFDKYNKAYNNVRANVMDAITYSAARANLAKTMDRVCEDHEPLIITRSGEQSVVMVSLDDFKALEETAYLLRNPTNAKRLLTAVAQLAAGQGKVRALAQ